jgi:hypothetical protein
VGYLEKGVNWCLRRSAPVRAAAGRYRSRFGKPGDLLPRPICWASDGHRHSRYARLPGRATHCGRLRRSGDPGRPRCADGACAYKIFETDVLPEPGFGALFTEGELRSNLVRTAVRFEELPTSACGASARISDGLLVDSIHAFYRGDYRTAILYSAFAVESIANEVLEAEYERLKSVDSAKKEHVRIVQIRVSRDVEQAKDPIYAALINGKGLGRLLHEAPLYLLRRSMLIEQQDLYYRGVKLYSTRNKIVHGQEAWVKGDVLPLDYAGAFEAIETAVLMFKWFGAGAGFVFPEGGFEDCESGFGWLT